MADDQWKEVLKVIATLDSPWRVRSVEHGLKNACRGMHRKYLVRMLDQFINHGYIFRVGNGRYVTSERGFARLDEIVIKG